VGKLLPFPREKDLDIHPDIQHTRSMYRAVLAAGRSASLTTDEAILLALRNGVTMTLSSVQREGHYAALNRLAKRAEVKYVAGAKVVITDRGRSRINRIELETVH
jgi:hypothetical protein